MEDGKKKFDYYQNVTDNVISNLKEVINSNRGDINTWAAAVPVNGVTGMSYTPDSKILLMIKQQGKENQDPRFFSFKQIQSLGYSLKYGAKSTNVVTVKTRDENGNLLPFDKQEKRFEQVFHASDVEQHTYKTDAQGNKLPLLDKEGNPRFSRKDGSPLYQYAIKPIPDFEEPKKWHVNISTETADRLFNSAETNVNQGFSMGDPQYYFCNAISRMTLEAETDIKFSKGLPSIDIQKLIPYFEADKKLFSAVVKEAGKITKEFKAELKKELAKQKEMDEEIPFDIPDEMKNDNNTKEDVPAATAKPVESNKTGNEKTENFMEAFGNNLAKLCYESMKASGINEKEMLSVVDAIKTRSVQMVQDRSNPNNISTNKTR